MAVENKRERVPKRVLSALVSSVAAGVVPRVGAPYIAIGRADELEALLSDLETISEGGSAMRFIIGRYGSGKSFLMQLLRGYACGARLCYGGCRPRPSAEYAAARAPVLQPTVN